MFIEKYLDLIEFYVLLARILFWVVTGLLLINLGGIVWLCYTEIRPKGGTRS